MAVTPTYVPLATYTVTGSPDAAVLFSSIPATYRDLIIYINGTAASAQQVLAKLNTSSANGSNVFMFGDGSSATSATNADVINFGTIDSTQCSNIVQLMDYSATDKHKTWLVRSNRSSIVFAYAARWAQTAAINSIEIYPDSAVSFNVGTTISIYGVA